jgi:hypothetical protein
MTAVWAVLDHKSLKTVHRTQLRRKLRLQAQGLAQSGTTEVLILDISTTGLLLETAEDLSRGDTIELDIPEAVVVRAVVKWSSGQLFGCQFREPISIAAVSAALLRASFGPPSLPEALAPTDNRHLVGDVAYESGRDEALSIAAKMRWIIGLALLSWVVVIAVTSLVWWLFH